MLWQTGSDRIDRTMAMTASGLTRWTRSLLALLIAIAATTAVAQDRPRRQGPPPGQQQQQSTAEGSVLRLLPPDAVSEHAIDTPTGKLEYTATAGTLLP